MSFAFLPQLSSPSIADSAAPCAHHGETGQQKSDDYDDIDDNFAICDSNEN